MAKWETGELKSDYYEIDRKMDLLRGRLGSLDADFAAKLDLSWLYHENALEGVVLTTEEIQAALDNQPVPDISLTPVYEEVRCHQRAIESIRKMADKKRLTLDLNLLKKLHCGFYENGNAKQGGKYRKDMPIHRLYFHEISQPDKISYRLRQVFDWASTQEARRLHPVKFAATFHYELMRVYPFTHHSGKLSRLLMNYVILQNGYLPAIIHAVERQRYYESLRLSAQASIGIVTEALENALDSTLRFLSTGPTARAAAQ